MKFTCNKSLLALALTVSASVLPAQAHELRYIGNSYLLQIGSDVEPPVAGQLNAVDFFAFYETTRGDINTAVALDRTQGDKVDIVVIPLKLTTESFNSPIAQVFPILTSFQQAVVEGYPAYVADITYPTTGAYGYIVSGRIKKAGKHDKFFVEKFVCGAGSQDTTWGTSFECVNQ